MSELTELKTKYAQLEHRYNQTIKLYEALQMQYITVVNLAKKNSDAYEYCLTSLERKIEELRNVK